MFTSQDVEGEILEEEEEQERRADRGKRRRRERRGPGKDSGRRWAKRGSQ